MHTTPGTLPREVDTITLTLPREAWVEVYRALRGYLLKLDRTLSPDKATLDAVGNAYDRVDDACLLDEKGRGP